MCCPDASVPLQRDPFTIGPWQRGRVAVWRQAARVSRESSPFDAAAFGGPTYY